MAIQSIPASKLVNIMPSVVSAGGAALEMATVVIDATSAIPVVGVQKFGSANEVGDYYGYGSLNKQFADRYFLGYEGATRLPQSLYFVDNREDESAALLVGASLRSMSLVDFKKITGAVSLVIDGAIKSGQVDMATATSFSDGATKLQEIFEGTTVKFCEQRQAYTIWTNSRGKAATLSFGSGDASEALGITEHSGAQVENGQNAMKEAEFAKYITTQTQNFAIITYMQEQTDEAHKEWAKWNTLQNSRYLYVAWGIQPNALIANNASSFGSWLEQTEQNGTMAYYGTVEQVAALCGGIAAINFKKENGRRNIMFMKQAGVSASVVDEADYTALISNGYTFYAAFATATTRFQFQTNGRVSGKFEWADTYVNQIYFSSQLQLALMEMLDSYDSIPYNSVGKAHHLAAVQDPINEMDNFGGIQPLEDPKALSEQQKAIINNKAGMDIIPDLINKGYKVLIGTADAQTRKARGPMPFYMWYTDGGSVQSVFLNVGNVQ